jgi:hypothetical protein
MTANRGTALRFVDAWVYWIMEYQLPRFGTQGCYRPDDDPPPGLFPIIQVEKSFRSKEERIAILAKYCLNVPRRQIGKTIQVPESTLRKIERDWLTRLTQQIETIDPETIVEKEVRDWFLLPQPEKLDIKSRVKVDWSLLYA